MTDPIGFKAGNDRLFTLKILKRNQKSFIVELMDGQRAEKKVRIRRDSGKLIWPSDKEGKGF